MLRNPAFLDKEINSPLIDKCGRYLQDNREHVLDLASSWPELVALHQDDREIDLDQHHDLSEQVTRIISEDAIRTFVTEEHRAVMVKVLNCVVFHLGDYHQGLGYVTGFLLLSLEPQDVARLLITVGTHKKYIPRYWCHEAVAYGTDAYVLYRIVKDLEPSIAAHISSQGVAPESFCQKWLVGLCVHVLPFQQLYIFFDMFLREGYTTSFKFGVALLKRMKAKLLSTKDIARLYSLLRLDTKVTAADDAQAIVDELPHVDLAAYDIESWRAEERVKIEERVRKAREIVEQEDSDFDDLSDSDDED